MRNYLWILSIAALTTTALAATAGTGGSVPLPEPALAELQEPAAAEAAPSAAEGEPAAVGFCVRDPEIQCPDVYDPVICDDGVTYSNGCVAGLACATGCVPTGGETS